MTRTTARADACQDMDHFGMLRGFQIRPGIEGDPRANERPIRGMHDTFIINRFVHPDSVKYRRLLTEIPD